MNLSNSLTFQLNTTYIAYAQEDERRARLSALPWCSRLAYLPVKEEIAGSNPVRTAQRTRRAAPGAIAQPSEQPAHNR